ncbi:MAG TPA: SDR family oxidoreductase [Rectinemataceae bacterium]|nr:SDR family oxidoreductase [Rectinemataceae bacterium]
MEYRLGGEWALVTGASSGIGAQVARRLASLGARLALVARRRDALDALAAELRSEFGSEVLVVPCDLSERGEPERLHADLSARGVAVSLLVNNAGYGIYGPFDGLDRGNEDAMLDLDVRAMLRLTTLFAADMRRRGSGRILLTASTAAYQPSPLYASYAAAKAFVLSYGLAVRQELLGSGVTLSVLCPGVTDTAFHSVAGHEDNAFKRATMMSSERVAALAVTGLLRGRAQIVPGLLNKVLAFSTRLLPRTAQAAVAGTLMA